MIMLKIIGCMVMGIWQLLIVVLFNVILEKKPFGISSHQRMNNENKL